MPVKTFLSSFFMCNTFSCSARRASFEKVASCNPSGELKLSPSALAELILEQSYLNLSTKTVAVESLRERVRLPPWRRMICRDKESPIPVPSCLVV